MRIFSPFRNLLLSVVLPLGAGVTAQADTEAWLLEMPTKAADAVVKAYLAEDPATYQKLVGLFPSLVEKGKMKEVDLISTDGKKTKGKNYPEKTHNSAVEGIHNTTVGWKYLVDPAGPESLRSLKISYRQPTVIFTADTVGLLGKQWTPTLIHSKSDGDRNAMVLFERDTAAAVERVKAARIVTVQRDLPTPSKITRIYTSAPRPRTFLIYREMTDSPEDIVYEYKTEVLKDAFLFKMSDRLEERGKFDYYSCEAKLVKGQARAKTKWTVVTKGKKPSKKDAKQEPEMIGNLQFSSQTLAP